MNSKDTKSEGNMVDDDPSRAGADHTARTEQAEYALVAEAITKSYREGDARLNVLRGISFAVRPGEWVAVTGRSGSGKSTLLHILAGLLDPDDGGVYVMGERLTAAGQAERANIRNRYMGFVYQFHHLLPEFSALENIAMPLLVGHVGVAEARQRALVLLEEIGLTDRAEHRPHELSGGERQRVSVARSLATRPAVVLADEPTGNLDADNASRMMDLMRQLCEEHDTAFLVVTHDAAIAARADRIHTLDHGRLDAL